MKAGSVRSEELSALTKSRSAIYGLLSSFYTQPVNYQFIERITKEDFRQVLSSAAFNKILPNDVINGLDIIKRFIQESSNKPREKLQEDLSVERTRLLRGIKPEYGPPPPYESVYREQRVVGASTLEALRKYSKAGVRLAGNCKEIPDHIGIELGFMQFLCDKEFEAWKRGDLEDAMKYLSMEKEFINEHLAEWVPTFCDLVIAQTNIGFYLGLARITKGFIEFDRKLIVDYLK